MKFICAAAKDGKLQEAGDFFTKEKDRVKTEIKFGQFIT